MNKKPKYLQNRQATSYFQVLWFFIVTSVIFVTNNFSLFANEINSLGIFDL